LFEEVSESVAQATFSAAIQGGMTWLDAAPLYGFGLAEERLGRFLKAHPGYKIAVSTKVGRILKPVEAADNHEYFKSPLAYRPIFDYSPAGIAHSFEGSLSRLGREHIELLLLHDIDRFHHPVGHRALVQCLLDKALPAMNRLKGEGCVDAIGLGVNEWDIGYEILSGADLDCVLLAGRYTLLNYTALTSGFLDACARRGVSVLAAGVFNSGFLAGGQFYDYRPATEALTHRRAELTQICRKFDVPLPAAAIQFVAAHPAVTSVVIGARSPQEIADILGWYRMTIPSYFWHQLRSLSLIPEEAPTPV